MLLAGCPRLRDRAVAARGCVRRHVPRQRDLHAARGRVTRRRPARRRAVAGPVRDLLPLADRPAASSARAWTPHTLTLFALHTPGAAVRGRPRRAHARGARRDAASLDSVLAEPIEDCLLRAPDGEPCLETKTPLDLERRAGAPARQHLPPRSRVAVRRARGRGGQLGHRDRDRQRAPRRRRRAPRRRRERHPGPQRGDGDPRLSLGRPSIRIGSSTLSPPATVTAGLLDGRASYMASAWTRCDSAASSPMTARYDRIGTGYAGTRREDPDRRRRIQAAPAAPRARPPSPHRGRPVARRRGTATPGAEQRPRRSPRLRRGSHPARPRPLISRWRASRPRP